MSVFGQIRIAKRPLLLSALTATLVAGLSGCVVEPVRPRYAGPAVVEGPRFSSEIVAVEPPAPRFEAVGVAPGPGYAWAPGYWNWEGGRHVWVGGRWLEPREGYRWEPHAWVREGGGWRLREGYWARR